MAARIEGDPGFLVNDPEGLLTIAERNLVDRREEGGLSRMDAVASVKSERVGPAALIGREGEIPAPHVPGGEIPNPNPNKVSFEEQKAAKKAEIARLIAQVKEFDELIDARDNAEDQYPPEPRRYALPPEPPSSEPESTFNTNDLDADHDNELSDDDLRVATVEDLVELVSEYPELRTRVIALEREKGDDARGELFVALGEEELA